MQLSIFDAPYVSHSETSKQAARQITDKAPSLRQRVLDALTASPMTDEQIASALGLNPSTARPRRIELVQRGLVEEVGVTLTASGRKAVVWGAKS
jgi:predicted ArsR family transcriptional regulator